THLTPLTVADLAAAYLAISRQPCARRGRVLAETRPSLSDRDVRVITGGAGACRARARVRPRRPRPRGCRDREPGRGSPEGGHGPLPRRAQRRIGRRARARTPRKQRGTCLKLCDGPGLVRASGGWRTRPGSR